MNYHLLILEIAVVALGLGVLLVDLWLPAAQKPKLGYLAALALGLILAGSFAMNASAVRHAFGEMYVLDPMALFFKRFFLLSAIIVLVMSVEFADRIEAGISEYYALILFALAGMMFAASANDFALLFVSVELITVTFYILTSFQRGRAGVAGGRRQISHSGRAVLRVHGLWHRAGVWHDGQIELRRDRGGGGPTCGQQAVPARHPAGAGGHRLQDCRVPGADVGAGRLSGLAHAHDGVSGGRLEGGGVCAAAARAVHRRAGHHRALDQTADRHFHRHHPLRQPVRDSAAEPEAAARLFEHRQRRLPADGRGRA